MAKYEKGISATVAPRDIPGGSTKLGNPGEWELAGDAGSRRDIRSGDGTLGNPSSWKRE